MSEILLEQGRQAADARRARGAMIGQSVAAIGQVPGQILEARDESRRREAALQLQQQEAARRAAADARVEQRDTERLDFDREKYRDEQDAKNHEAAIRGAVNIADHGYPDEAMNAFVRDLAQHAGSKEEAAQLAEIGQTPQGRKAIVDGLIATAPKQKPSFRNVNPGDVVIDENNPTAGPVFSAPPLPPKPEPLVKPTTMVTKGPGGRPIRRTVTDAELAAGVEEYEKPNAPPAESQDIVQVMGPNGVPVWVKKSDAVGKPAAQAPRAVTGQERQSLAYFNRAKDAVDTITKGGDDSIEKQIAKSGYLSQQQLQRAPNVLQTQQQQSYRQAQRSFTEARLRKESGAAIPNSEYENDAKTYFAQPGDDDKIVEQKRKSRQTVLDGLKFSAGKAYDEYYGEPNVSPARQGGNAGPDPYDEYLKRQQNAR